MGTVFNVAGGSIATYKDTENIQIQNIQVSLKAGYTNIYYLHEYFNPESVTVSLTYSDGSTNDNVSNYIWYPARPLEPTDEYITFKAVQDGNIVQTRFNIVVQDYLLVDIPTYSNTLVYNGNVQIPNWEYDTSKIKIIEGGNARAQAGTYTTVFGLIDKTKTRWNIPTDQDYFADQTVQWTIEKKTSDIQIQPPFENKSYLNSHIAYLRQGDNFDFILKYDGSPTGSLSGDISAGAITVSASTGFNNNIIYSYSSNTQNKVLNVRFEGNQAFNEGQECSLTFTINNDKFINHTYPNNFTLTFLLYKAWSFGTYSDGSIADKEWFQGLSQALSKRYYLSGWIGSKKHMVLDNEVLGTLQTDIVCIGVSSSHIDFQFDTTLDNPLKPEYSGSGTQSEYLTSTFQIINDQLSNAIPGRDYMAVIPQKIVTSGFAGSTQINNKKVVTPTACDLGLIEPDVDSTQNNPEDISYGDYNGEIINSYYIDNSKRQKHPNNSVNNVKYWTRSTYVKYLQSGQEKRHFVVVNENGEGIDINAETTEENIYHAPIFRITSLSAL